MKPSRLILAFLALMAVYHTAGAIWGRDAKWYLLVGIVIVSSLLSLAIFILQRRLQDSSTDCDSTPEADIDLDALIPGPRLTGVRRIIDGILGVIAAFGPPVFLTVWRGERLSLDGEFTGYHFLAMVVGVGLYFFVRQWVWRSFTP
ncbi:MAG: hypothetical protein ACOYMN_10140 [Roseimicrobium sp.]